MRTAMGGDRRQEAGPFSFLVPNCSRDEAHADECPLSRVKRTYSRCEVAPIKARLRNASRIAPLSLYDHFKAAVDQALPVKGHGVYVRLYARIGHDFLHGLVPHVARWPDDPGEDDRFIFLP